jgi:phenylacetate-coenzyme A ligase PaaK-like adenylate-forming protein
LILPEVPESFRQRPYARQHYSAIAGWAASEHPFYRKRVSGERPAFPVIGRMDVQLDNDLLLNGHASTGKTSGSTSTPVRVSWSRARAQMDKRDTALYVRWLGGPMPNARIVSTVAHEANEATIDVTSPLEQQVEFILRRQRDVGACALITYPSNLALLCRHVVEQGIDMRFMRRVVSLSEVYETWLDELAKEAFPNAVSTITYSSVELGLIAVRCPHRPENYHIMAHKLGVEFLDVEGRPCRDGQPGQVVVTDYWNRRSTLVRYALGDLAAPATCGCGRIGAPAMTNIIGKVRGVLKHADGRPVLFTGLSPMFRDSPEIRQFQVLQPALGRFVVRHVPKQGADMEGFYARVRNRFVEDFGAEATVEFEAMDAIPRSAGGKFHGSICLA